jgi:hypothetical protein
MYYSYIEIEYVATSFSPTRMDLTVKLLRDEAKRNVNKQSKRVYEQAKERDGGGFRVGDIVRVPLDNVGRTKVDRAGIVGVVVESNKKHASCRVAVKAGLKRVSPLNCRVDGQTGWSVHHLSITEISEF